MSQTVGEFFVERLQQWGVKTIFGYPGDGVNGILRGLEKAGDTFEFVQARHEEMAAFMAVGYAKFSGKLGVCLSTGGPGATHMITGLYDAKADHVPVLAITGQAARSVRGAHYQQELNLDRMFADVAGVRAGGCHAAAGRPDPGPRRPHRQRPQRSRRGHHAERPVRTPPTRNPSASTASRTPPQATLGRRSSPRRTICAGPPRC